MEESTDKNKAEANAGLEFNPNELETVDISDTKLEEEDKKHADAKKHAKKTAKKILSHDERKKLWIKRGVIGGLLVVVAMGILLAIPFTRWPILNTLGFRGGLMITVEDDNNKPVANATVRLEEELVTTSDRFGRAYFREATLGKKTVVIQKVGYGDKTISVTNGFGSAEHVHQLKVIGIKLDIDIKNWLSGQPVEGATTEYGKASAISDADGRASLVIPPTDEETVAITIRADGYIERKIETETNVVSRETSLVPAQKNYFVSKRDGKFDIFSSNLDGSEQRKIIEATGKEDESILQFSIHRANKQAILVANRDGKIQNRRLVAGIYVVDLERSAIRKIDEGSDVQLFDWGENSIAYTKTAAELNYDDPALSRIMAFNVNSGRLSEVASTNYFQASQVAQNKVFYMPADAYRPIENAALTSFDLNSGARRTYLPERPISYIGRASYQTLELQDSAGSAFELQLDRGNVKPIDRRPAASLSMALSPNGEIASWSDRRDGQGALLVRSIKENTERVVTKAPGLTNPVRFIADNTVIVRVVTSEETADYVVDINSGKFKKIVDVSNIGGLRQPGL